MGVIVQNIIKCYFSFFSPLDPARLRQLVNSWRENQLFWKISILKLTSRSRWCSLEIYSLKDLNLVFVLKICIFLQMICTVKVIQQDVLSIRVLRLIGDLQI